MYRSVGTIASDVECQWLGPKWPVWLEPKWPAQASNFVRKPGSSHCLRCGLQQAGLHNWLHTKLLRCGLQQAVLHNWLHTKLLRGGLQQAVLHNWLHTKLLRGGLQ
jgi:hypothetical protein